MKLVSSPKTYMEDGQRTVDPGTTLKRIEPLCRTAGITRVADITGLDRIGIPVFSSIRPSAESGAVSVYNGKGASKDQAKVSAIMEALERYSGEVRGDSLVRKGVEDMLSSGNALDPRELLLPARTMVHLMHQPIAWIEGWDLMEDEGMFVPASAVFHPYASRLDLPLFRTNTNGLASGNTMEEAILHGLCEVMERDAWSICEARREIEAGMEPPRGNWIIDDLVAKFSGQGVRLYLKDLTSDIGAPTFAAAADDERTKDPSLLVLGMGTHLNPEIALIRALTEAAQSRLTQIHGAREDTVKVEANRRLGYDRVKSMNRMWFSASVVTRGVEEYAGLDSTDILEDICLVIERLRAMGFRHAVAVDLTRKELDIPVVRVVVPGMEVFAVDEERRGCRLGG